MPSYSFRAFPDVEDANGLPAGVLDAVIQQESGGVPDANRYEPKFFERYIRGVSKADLRGVWPGNASEDTERYGRATSWGLMQVLGQVARELGYDRTFFTSLCSNPVLGVQFGARHLAAKLKKYGNLPDALSAYNAGKPIGGNRARYVQPILDRMEAADVR